MERFINVNSQYILGNRLIDIEKAYCAAFIDGEGTITLRLRKGEENSRKKGLIFFDPRIIAYNTEREVLDWIRNTVNYGTIKSSKRTKGKTQYRWELRPQKKVRKFLSDILPYLKIERKKRLATLLLEWITIHENTRNNSKHYIKGKRGSEKIVWSPREYEIVEEIRRLNKK